MGLEAKLDDIRLPADFHWVETLAITGNTPLELEDAHDDLRREAAFYTASLRAANIGLKNLKQMGIPFERPEDFYAEMVKTDEHMRKVKAVLLTEKKKIDAVATRQKEKSARKFAKQVHSQRIQDKHRQKREALESIKGMGKTGVKEKMKIRWTGDDAATREEYSSARRGAAGTRKKSRKRELADKKWGHGGRKKRAKRNDAASAADMGDYNPRFNSNSSKKKKRRPGKNARRRQG